MLDLFLFSTLVRARLLRRTGEIEVEKLWLAKTTRQVANVFSAPHPPPTPLAAQRRKVTEEGLEANLAVNYLGNFLLTTQLLPLLKQSGDGRVLCVNSSLHRKVCVLAGGRGPRPKDRPKKYRSFRVRGFFGLCVFVGVAVASALCLRAVLRGRSPVSLSAHGDGMGIDSCSGGRATACSVRGLCCRKISPSFGVAGEVGAGFRP